MQKNPLVSILLVAIVLLSFGKFHYPKYHLSGNYYIETYFPNNDRISYKLANGKFMPVIDMHVKSTSTNDSLLFINVADRDSFSWFIIDSRRDFGATNGRNVLGPINRENYKRLCANPAQLSMAWHDHE